MKHPPPPLRPSDLETFADCRLHAEAQLSEECRVPFADVEPRRVYERACRLYNREGGRWKTNDCKWQFI